MLYVLFLCIAIFYNIRKFAKQREVFLSSIVEAQTESHRRMILGHHFYIFIFEAFISIIVAHLITERATSLGLLSMGSIYVGLLISGIYFYRFFVRYIEKKTGIELWASFRVHLVKELRVSFAIILLPILIYSLISWTFQDEVYQEWGSFWFIGMLFNIIFVSVLTIFCSVIFMLRLIPNREITEPEYLAIITDQLEKIGMPGMRVRWIETDIKNAFVVGLKLLSFSNQTMFIGRTLRTKLSMDEFEAVVAHELGHVANGHIQKRVIELLKNFTSILFGLLFILFTIFLVSFFYWGEDMELHTEKMTLICVLGMFTWIFINYSVLFDSFRAQEFEADAYAVMKLNVRPEALESALRKLTSEDELPEYLRNLSSKTAEKNVFFSWLSQKFSTHPQINARVQMIKFKLDAGLPYNFYVSPIKKLRMAFAQLFKWKVFIPVTSVFVLTTILGVWDLKKNKETISFIKNSNSEQIMNSQEIVKKINSKPYYVGPSLMAWIVKKNDPKLIDYFLSKGANKGKTLMYVSLHKDLVLFKKYYELYESELTQDDYYLILRKTAETNFTPGYRFLVNSKHFEELRPDYKERMTRLHMSNNRQPASIK